MSKLLILLVAVFLAALLPARALAADKLLFEQAGSTNWAIKDFSIIVGPLSATTRNTIFVISGMYSTIAATVARVGTPKPTTNDVFAVTNFRDDLRISTTFIPDKAVIDIMRLVTLMFEAQHQAVPSFVPEIANSFEHGR